MKKIFLVSFLVCSSMIAQVTDTGTNVGVGTTTPSYKLDVVGTGRFSSDLLIGDPNGARTEINTNTNHKIYAPTNKKTIDLDGNFQGGGFVGVYRADNGKKGVSIECKPDSGHYNNSLSIRQLRLDNIDRESIKLSSTILSGDTEPTNFMHMPYQNSTIVIGEWGAYKKGLGYGLINKFKTSFENDVYVETGNVGIGTITPDAKLAVKGDIHANEVKVDLLGAVAPDYVFYKDYDLKTLTELENYIVKKGHLPNIPSAKEMETNGVRLKEMNLKLLEKIEELTLYTIQQEKQLKNQATEYQELKQRLQKLEALLLKDN